MPGAVIYLLRLLPLLLFHIATPWTPSARAATARVLIYTATQGFRHASIEAAVKALIESGSSIDATFDSTDNEYDFTIDNLNKYDSLVFLSTTGDVLHSKGLEAFQQYINAGGNFVGIHAASDALRDSGTYTRELGSLFESHLSLRTFVVSVTESEHEHPSVIKLPRHWTVHDEVYHFNSDPTLIGAKVVLFADKLNTGRRPIGRCNTSVSDPSTELLSVTAWFQEKGAGVEAGGIPGRSFYTALGHEEGIWSDDLFKSHVLGGISWVLQSKTTRAFNSTA